MSFLVSGKARNLPEFPSGTNISISKNNITYKDSLKKTDEKFIAEIGQVFHLPTLHNSELQTYAVNFDDVVSGTGEILSDKKVDGKERPWKIHKQASTVLANTIFPLALKVDTECISDNALFSLQNCSGWLLFRRYFETQVMKLEKAFFCKNRLCPTCNWRKSLKLYSQMQEVSSSLIQDFPTARYLFLTLTVKNCAPDQLENTIDKMNQGFKDLVNKGKTRASTKGLKTNLLGYAKAMEIKYDSEPFITPEMYKKSKKYYDLLGLKAGSKNPNYDKYHPHFHVLIMVKDAFFKTGYIKQSQWVDIWQDCMSLDYVPVVDVRVIKPNKKRLDSGASINVNEVAMSSAISETMKYPVKPDSLKLLDFETMEKNEQGKIVEAVALLSRVLHRRRLVTFGGEILKMRKLLQQDDPEDGNLIHVKDDVSVDGEFELVLFNWLKVGCYIC